MWGGVLGGRSAKKSTKEPVATPERKASVPTTKSTPRTQAPRSAIKAVQQVEEADSTSVIDASSVTDDATNVQVLVRIRPINSREHSIEGGRSCLTQHGSAGINVVVNSRSHSFKFDEVCGSDSTQEELFKRAGKTYTMQGDLGKDASHTQHGLTPRVFQAIFQAIEEREGEQQGALRQYTCKCSFLQIYNEQVTDLLRPSSQTLTLRYDVKAGVYAENLSEHIVVNAEDAMQLIIQGAANRRVGETKMNEQSSRSHSVFTMKVECRSSTDSGLVHTQYGTLHMVDLAGSERVKISGADGSALTEASEINKSLSVLSRVISKVVEAQRDKQPNRHVPYRDSKLTFLLQDSLGGNAKTMVIANVSPSVCCEHETKSTLAFASGMKSVRNRAKINTDTLGDTKALQAEIERLHAELARVQDGFTAELSRERDELKVKLESCKAALREADSKLENSKEDNKQLQYRLERLDEKLDAKDREYVHLEEQLQKLMEGSAADVRTMKDSYEAEMAALRMAHRQAVEAHQRELAAKVEELVSKHQTELEDALARLRSEHGDIAALHKNALEALEERCKADALEQVRSLQAGAAGEQEAALMAAAEKHKAELSEIQAEYDAALAEAQGSHAESEKALADAIGRLEEDLADAAKVHVWQLQELKEQHEAELETQLADAQAAAAAELQRRLDEAARVHDASVAELHAEAEARLAAELKALAGQHEQNMQAERERAAAAAQATQSAAGAAHALELEKERLAATTALKDALESLRAEHGEKAVKAQEAHDARVRELQVASDAIKDELYKAQQQWTAEKAELHATAEASLAAAKQEISDTKSDLAGVSSSKEALEKQLAETKAELAAKTAAAEAASNRVAELTECLRGAEARSAELREQGKSTEERHGTAVAVLRTEIADKTAALEGAREEISALQSQLTKLEIDAEAKINTQQSLLAQREEQNASIRSDLERCLREAQEASAARDTADSTTRAEHVARVAALEAAVADRDAKVEGVLAEKERALTAAAEAHAAAIGALNAEQRAAERSAAEAASAEATKLREEAAAAAAEAQRAQFALREEAAAAAAAAAAELRSVRDETAAQTSQLQENYATLLAECEQLKAMLAEQREEEERAQAAAAEAREAAALESLQVQEEHDGVLVMKDAEIDRLRESLARAEEDAAEQIDKLQNAEMKRLRNSLARAEEDAAEQIDKLQTERVAQEEEFKELEARLSSALEAAAQKYESLEAEAAANAAALQADSLTQCETLRDELNAHQSAHEQALARHEAELQAASIRHKELAEDSARRLREAQAAADAEAAKVASVREQLVAAQEALASERQAGAAAEERCGKLDEDVADQRGQVQELTKECAALREQVAELRGKLSGADNVRAEATEATRTIVRREQEIDRLKEDLGDANAQISMLRAELAEAEASHRMAAEQARQELQELQDKYEDAQEDLKVAEQQFEQLEHERDIERETAQSKMDAADYYAGLISEIQEKLASSRPGSACDSRNSEAMINTLRQSIDAAGIGRKLKRPMEQRAPPTPPRGLTKPNSYALRTAETTPTRTPGHSGSLIGPIPTHNEYLTRERGLGKPCLQMDMTAFEHMPVDGGSENSSPNNAKQRGWRRVLQ